MECEVQVVLVGIFVEVVNPSGVEGRGTALNAMDGIALVEQERR
jgi:hypothetical protein